MDVLMVGLVWSSLDVVGPSHVAAALPDLVALNVRSDCDMNTYSLN